VDVPTSGPATLDFRLPAHGAFDLVVTDADTGTGVPGIWVVASPTEPWGAHWVGTSGEEGWVRVGPIRRSAGVHFTVFRPWTLPEGGEVPLPPVVSAPIRVQVRRDASHDETQAGWQALAETFARQEARANSLRVRVVDANGTPVANARVHYKNLVRGSGYHGRTEVVAGVATVPRRTDPEAVTYVAVGDAVGPGGEFLPLGDARTGPIPAETEEIELRLLPERVVVGRVLDAKGNGVVGLRVQVVDVDGEESFLTERRSEGVRTGLDGGFRAAGLSGEAFLLILATPERWVEVPPFRVAADSAPVEVRLRDAVTATIHVTDDGRPSAGADVMAWSDVGTPEGAQRLWWSRSHSVTTGADGVARLRGLDPSATYRLNVNLDGGKWKGGRTKETPDWVPADTSVAFGANRTIRGIVRDRAGSGVAAAHVIGWTGSARTGHTTTDASGSFALPDEGVGLRQVFASMWEWGKGPWSGLVAVPDGDAPVALTLDPGLAISVRLVTDAVKRRPVLLTSDLDAADGGAEYQFGTTDDEGVVTFRGLRADRAYSVWAKSVWVEERAAYDGVCGLLVAAKASATPSSVPLPLRPGGMIRVHLKGVWNSPSGEAKHGLLTVYGEQGPHGTIVFSGLCDLDWAITIEDGPRRAAATARPGANLTLEPAPTPAK
jgi:hypothetical protein